MDPIEVKQNEEESERAIEMDELKNPYKLAMQGHWGALKRYYQRNPQKVKCFMTLSEDTVFHIVASRVKNSEGKGFLEFLLNLLQNHDDKCEALRRKNSSGNNTLHEVAHSDNLEAAKFLVTYFNDPAADVISTSTSTSTDDATLPLLETLNELGETPLYRAAAFGHTELVCFYIRKAEEDNPNNVGQHFHRKDKMSILHIAVISQHFETAFWLQKNYTFLATRKEQQGLTSLQLLAQMPTAFKPQFQENEWKMWKMLIYKYLPVMEDLQEDQVTLKKKDDLENSLDSNQPHQSKKISATSRVYFSLWNFLACLLSGLFSSTEIWKEKKKHKALVKLIPLLVEKDYSWAVLTKFKGKTTKTISLGLKNSHTTDADGGGGQNKEAAKSTEKDHPAQKVYDYTPLLIATIKGIAPIVEEILNQHPQAGEHVSEDEETILHLAVKNCHKRIFKIIKKWPVLWLRLNEGIDGNGNTILHQAADMSYYSVAMSRKVIGPVMLLRKELRWMQRVRKIVPPHYIMHRNNKGQTAEELFNDLHNPLLIKAQEWIKETSQACSTVAVLVVSVVFAASYAFPEGNDGSKNESGKPGVQDSPLFWLFTSMDVVAISSSLSSVAFFLSILSSPLEYPHFCKSLPRKLMIGFVLLFVSMATTMIAFAASILLLIRLEKKWTKSLFYPVAFFPVPLFGLMQFPMRQTGKFMKKFIFKFMKKFIFKFMIKFIPNTATKIFHGFLFPFRQLRRCCTKKSRAH